MKKYLEFSEEVESALQDGRPILALESTIISHGMPYPQNLETAISLENICRAKGVVPATIAIMDGKIKIGLDSKELEILASSDEVSKVSRRDIPYVLQSKKLGATTVAATMIGAEAAGIQVFSTGGIGGVHRGYNEILDISADLTELSKTNVAVVCAGIKSILDIPNTIEHLETLGVPVLGYQSDYLASFYCRSSNTPVNFNMEDSASIAEFLKIKWDCDLNGGVIISNPIPTEFAQDDKEMNEIINRSIEEMKKKKVTGKNITPYLLNEIKELTQGKSLEANIELVKNNVDLGSDIAKDLAGLLN